MTNLFPLEVPTKYLLSSDESCKPTHIALAETRLGNSFNYRYRQLYTKFVDNKLNYMLSCKAAFKERNNYYLERWAEYYADCF